MDFEVLPEMTRRQAARRAAELLADRAGGGWVQVWRDEELRLSLPLSRAPTPARP